MRVGQTSAIVFVSKLVASLLGFLATVYFARVLGAEVLGYYAVILALAAWLKLGGEVGVSSALTKRLSEEQEQPKYFTAGLILVATFGIAVSISVLVLRDFVDAYVGVDAALLVVLLITVGLFHQLVRATLNGERLVHISGLLSPVRTGLRSLIQIGLVVLGWGLSGMVLGYAAGTLLVGLIGVLFLSIQISRPRREHFRSLYDYAKYAWLGGLKSRSWNDIDILVLGAFVSASLVGVYSVAWGTAKFLNLFGSSVTKTIFPELSHADANEKGELVTSLIEDSLTYGGLILIPGLFGGILLADRLLLIYGPEFTAGTTVFVVLLLAYLVFGYWKQLMNALKALDRPDMAFRINAIFIVINVSLNIVLVASIGWLGAAIATTISVTVGLILAFRSLRNIVSFTVPFTEISRQWFAAIVMGVVIYITRQFGEAHWVGTYNEVFVVLLVSLGAGLYFVVLLAISSEFRTMVNRNVPLELPLVRG